MERLQRKECLPVQGSKFGIAHLEDIAEDKNDLAAYLTVCDIPNVKTYQLVAGGRTSVNNLATIGLNNYHLLYYQLYTPINP